MLEFSMVLGTQRVHISSPDKDTVRLTIEHINKASGRSRTVDIPAKDLRKALDMLGL